MLSTDSYYLTGCVRYFTSGESVDVGVHVIWRSYRSDASWGLAGSQLEQVLFGTEESKKEIQESLEHRQGGRDH